MGGVTQFTSTPSKTGRSRYVTMPMDCIQAVLQGSVTNAWWDGPYFHPRTWTAKDISQDLMMKLRKSNHGFEANADINCNDEDAMQSLRLIFPNQRSKESRSRRSRGLQHVAAIATKRTDFQVGWLECDRRLSLPPLSTPQTPIIAAFYDALHSG